MCSIQIKNVTSKGTNLTTKSLKGLIIYNNWRD